MGIMHIINDSLSDVVQSDETRLLYGQDYFYETLLGLRFKISTFPSSSQTHWQPKYCTPLCVITLVTPRIKKYLTSTAVLELLPSFLLLLRKRLSAWKLLKEAVEAAKVNAALNGLTNCRFIAGDVLKVLDDLTAKTRYDHSGSPSRWNPPQSAAEDPGIWSGKHRLYLLQTNKSCKRFTCISGSWL